jgi:hypothetical protein
MQFVFKFYLLIILIRIQKEKQVAWVYDFEMFSIIWFCEATETMCFSSLKNGRTALMVASTRGFADVVNVLMQQGADASTVDKVWNNSNLEFIISSRFDDNHL